MSRRRSIPVLATAVAAALACASLAPAGPATEPSTTRPSPTPAATRPADADVAALVRQLGADEEPDRSAAQRQLVDLGSTAVDGLTRAAADDPDAEVRSRSAAALAQIRDRDANGPSLITLHAHDAEPRTVLDQVGRQAHAELLAPYLALAARVGRPQPKVTLDADRRPFWDVMADVCGQLDVCPLPDAPPAHNALSLYHQQRNWLTPAAPHQVVGPFWVGVAGLYRLSSVDLAGPPTTDDQFLARLIVFPEPKLVVTAVSPMTVRTAVDDAGNSLVPPPPPPAAARLLALRPPARVPARTVEARLLYPTDRPDGRPDGRPVGTRITTLAGDLTVTLAQGAQRFEADDVVDHPTVTRPLPGVKVRVGVARVGTGTLYQVTVDCARDGMPDQPWQAMTNRVNDLSVEDAAGRPLTPPGGWTVDSANTPTSFKATGLFSRAARPDLVLNNMAAVARGNPAIAPPPPVGDPRRIVWIVAARFKVVTVPVTFHDLPMP